MRALVLLGSLFQLASLLELFPLLVGAKQPVPPDESAGVIAVEVVVMEVVKTSTCIEWKCSIMQAGTKISRGKICVQKYVCIAITHWLPFFVVKIFYGFLKNNYYVSKILCHNHCGI